VQTRSLSRVEEEGGDLSKGKVFLALHVAMRLLQIFIIYAPETITGAWRVKPTGACLKWGSPENVGQTEFDKIAHPPLWPVLFEAAERSSDTHSKFYLSVILSRRSSFPSNAPWRDAGVIVE